MSSPDSVPALRTPVLTGFLVAIAAAVLSQAVLAGQFISGSADVRFLHLIVGSALPWLALVPAVILSVIWTFNMFNVIYLVSAGEPGGATEILMTQAYKLAFEQYRAGRHDTESFEKIEPGVAIGNIGGRLAEDANLA